MKLTLFFLTLAVAAPSWATTSFSIQPTPTVVAPGQTFDLTVVLTSDDDDIYGFQFDLLFPTFLNVENITEDGFFLANSAIGGLFYNTPDNVDGNVTDVLDASSSPDTDASTGDSLVTFEFLAVASGTGQVSIDPNTVLLSDPNGNPLEIDSLNPANVTVTPEPSTLALLIPFVLAWFVWHRRRAAAAAIALVTAVCAHAEVTYVQTVSDARTGKTTSVTHIKGDKAMIDGSSSARIVDLDARTVTTISKSRKLYSIRKLGNRPRTQEASIQKAEAAISKPSLRATGRTEKINGYNAREFVVTADVNAQRVSPNAPVEVIVDVWVSSDVPGTGELREFQKKNTLAMAASGPSEIQGSLVGLQRELEKLDGIPVREIVKVKTLGKEAVARITDLTGFSTTPAKESVFAVPSDYHQAR